MPDLPRFRALLVEDDSAIRRLVEKLLTRRGVAIDAVADGRRAIEQLDGGTRYDAVILDLMVPEVSGFDVIRHVYEHHRDTPVAVVSAVSQQALTKLDSRVVKLVISKPFDVDQFTKGVLALCEGAEGRVVSG